MIQENANWSRHFVLTACSVSLGNWATNHVIALIRAGECYRSAENAKQVGIESRNLSVVRTKSNTWGIGLKKRIVGEYTNSVTNSNMEDTQR
jgi:hypothetical protein